MIDCLDESKEHIAIAISGAPDNESGKIFGVRKLESSTGANQTLSRDEGLV